MSYSLIFTIAFAAALVAGLLVKFWLASRQSRHVARHRGEVPERPSRRRSRSSAHQKAADYTVAKARFGTGRDGLEHGAAAGLDLAGRPRPAQQACCWLGSAAAWCSNWCCWRAFAAIGGLLELPVHAVADLQARGALRLQQDDLAGLWLRRHASTPTLIGAAHRAADRGADPRGSWARPARCGGSGPGPRGWASTCC